MADVRLVCQRCGTQWYVPADALRAPSAGQLNKARRQTSVAYGGVFTRGRRLTRYQILDDQAARARDLMRCPQCGSSEARQATEPRWLRDPSGAPIERWWDGARWSDQTRPIPGAAPPAPPPPPPPPPPQAPTPF